MMRLHCLILAACSACGGGDGGSRDPVVTADAGPAADPRDAPDPGDAPDEIFDEDARDDEDPYDPNPY